MQWYKISCRAGHVGSGKRYDQTSYIYNRDIMAVVRIFRRQGGFPHNKFPEIRALNEEESSVLEDYVCNEAWHAFEQSKKNLFEIQKRESSCIIF